MLFQRGTYLRSCHTWRGRDYLKTAPCIEPKRTRSSLVTSLVPLKSGSFYCPDQREKVLVPIPQLCWGVLPGHHQVKKKTRTTLSQVSYRAGALVWVWGQSGSLVGLGLGRITGMGQGWEENEEGAGSWSHKPGTNPANYGSKQEKERRGVTPAQVQAITRHNTGTGSGRGHRSGTCL